MKLTIDPALAQLIVDEAEALEKCHDPWHKPHLQENLNTLVLMALRPAIIEEARKTLKAHTDR